MSAIHTPGTTDSANAEWLPIESGAGDRMPEMLSALFAGNPDMVIVTGPEG